MSNAAPETQNAAQHGSAALCFGESLAHLRDILKIITDEEAANRDILLSIAYEPTAEEKEYMRQFNATKLSVLKAIERCVNEKLSESARENPKL